MAIEDDYLIKQIKAIAKVIAQLLFKRDDFEYVLPKDGKYSEYDNLYLKVMGLIDNGNYNEAEDEMFNNIDGRNPVYLQIATMMYIKLAGIDEKDLQQHNFSKLEVEQGFLDMLKLYNIKISKK